MTAPIAAIGAVAPLQSTTATASTAAAPSSDPAAFAQALSDGFDAVSNTQQTADGLAVQAANGTLTDPAQYTIAATQAQLMTQLTTTIENKAVNAFNTIMGMQA